MGNIPLAGCSFHFLRPQWNSAAQWSGRKCQCSEANFLNESLPENWPHSSLSVLISRQHASFPSYGIWREFSSEKDVPGGKKLTQCVERSLVSSQGGDQRDLCLGNSLCLPRILQLTLGQLFSSCGILLCTSKMLIWDNFANGILFSYVQ